MADADVQAHGYPPLSVGEYLDSGVLGHADGRPFELPPEIVTQTVAILAMRRSGKSNAAVAIAEELWKAGLHWVAIDPKGDWWGMRAAGPGGPGLPVTVFGGEHGDLDLHPEAGAIVAELIAENRLTCILDTSSFSKAQRRRFLTDLAETLYRINREPCLLICEEADEYIPQRVGAEDARLVGAFETLVKRGGFHGLGVLLVTQRSASLNKDVLTQVETLITLRTTSPQDRKAVLDWVVHYSVGPGAVASLPSLQNGEAWLFSPTWLKLQTRVRFRRRHTFDSGATPTLGAMRPAAGALVAAPTLDEVRARLDAAAAEAPAPSVGTSEVRRLRRELAETAELLTDAHERHEDDLRAISEARAALVQALAALARIDDGPKASAPPDIEPPAVPAPAPRPAPRPAVVADPVADAPGLRKGARRMLATLVARSGGLGLTRTQLATLAGFAPSGGTFQTYLGDLRRVGAVETSGGFVTITKGGRALAGDVEPVDTLTHWRSVLRAGERRFLDVLLDVHPAGLTRAELAERAGNALTGGTFQTYLGVLRRNGLVEARGDRFYASATLFLAPAV